MFARVQAALSRLRELGTTDQAIRAIASEALTLGFSRIIVSRVRDGFWIPEVCLIDGDPAWGEEIVAAGRADPQRLDHMILETEMVRLRAPMLVRDVQNDPRTHRPIADASFSRSYVTAPLMPEGRVIGFIHADCYVMQRDVDEFDRDVLWMFAEGAGYAFERTVLLERLRDLRVRVRDLTGSIEAVIDEVVDAEVEMARLDRQTAAVTRAASAAIVQPRVAAAHAAHAARARDRPADGGRSHEPGDRTAPGHLRGHRQDAREQPPAQAAREQPRPGGVDVHAPGAARARRRVSGGRAKARMMRAFPSCRRTGRDSNSR